MKSLLWKDLKNARFVTWPAFWLGVPLLLILQFCSNQTDLVTIHWKTAYWVVFFFSATALFYRSFAQEHRFQNFGVYISFQVPRWKILLSQGLIHWLVLLAMSLSYLALIFILWSPQDFPFVQALLVSALTSLALCSMGSLLGLMLQIEREFLFSIFFMPVATPLILAAYSLTAAWSWNWLSLSLSFLILGSFLSFFVFEFFFDELI